MSMKAKRILALLVACLMVFTLFTGCAQKETANEGEKGTDQTETQAPTGDDSTGEEQPKYDKNATIVWKVRSDQLESFAPKLVEGFKEETGITVELSPIPGTTDEFYNKMDMILMTGDDVDIFDLENPIAAQKYVGADLLLSIDDLANEDTDYNVDEIYGDYLSRYDGKLYYLPKTATYWAVYYNKKMFDEHNIAYPENGWTWDDFIEKAKKMTDIEKEVYGSLMPTFNNMWYFKAMMTGAGDGYKEDGTSDFDSPAFKDAVKWFNDLSVVHKIQPSIIEQKLKGTDKLHPAFWSGKIGMIVVGTWFSSGVGNTDNFPRDFDTGMAPLPVFKDSEVNNNMGVTSALAIPKNSKHAREAYEFMKYAAENTWKLRGEVPALVKYRSEENSLELVNSLSEAVKGMLKPEDLQKAIFTSGLGYNSEKILGPVSNEYNSIIGQECEELSSGASTLEDTVTTIKSRVDEAIKKAKK